MRSQCQNVNIYFHCYLRCFRWSRGLFHSQEEPLWFAEKRRGGGRRSLCSTEFQNHKIQTRHPQPVGALRPSYHKVSEIFQEPVGKMSYCGFFLWMKRTSLFVFQHRGSCPPKDGWHAENEAQTEGQRSQRRGNLMRNYGLSLVYIVASEKMSSKWVCMWLGVFEQLGVYTRGNISRSLRTNMENKDTEESQGETLDLMTTFISITRYHFCNVK